MISLVQLDWPLLLAVLSIVSFAGLVHGTLGLGFPMVATPMLAVFFDVRVAILITLLPTVAVNIASIWHHRNSLSRTRKFLPLSGFVLVGSLLGAAILTSVDPTVFRPVLAGLILLYLWGSHAGRMPRHWLEANNLLGMAIFGTLAGIFAGVTNVMVAVLIMYLLALEIPRATTVGVLNACFLIGKAAQIAVLAAAGLVGATLLYETAPLAVVAVAALSFGQHLSKRIAVDTYRRALRLLLSVLAAVLIAQFLFEVL